MIPFNRPALVGDEEENLRAVLARRVFAGDGEFGRRCERLLEEVLGVPRVLLTTSCTHALEMSAMLLDLREGDEVIVPSFTFVSTANAFVLRGAKPVFADIRADTLNLDENLLESLITPRTRAILPVHYAGVACAMKEIGAIAARHDVAIVEDNAHGLLGTLGEKALGTFGVLAAQSFHETKNFSCGEGGALLVNDARFIERAEVLREKGTNRSRFFRGEVDKYSWIDVGSSYVLSELLAAVLLAQLDQRALIQSARRRIWERYAADLASWAERGDIRLPNVPADCGQAFHMFHLRFTSLERRTAFIRHMRAREVATPFHYLPLHLSAMGRQFGGAPGDCPVTERASDELVRLPFYTELSDPDQALVIERALEFA